MNKKDLTESNAIHKIIPTECGSGVGSEVNRKLALQAQNRVARCDNINYNTKSLCKTHKVQMGHYLGRIFEGYMVCILSTFPERHETLEVV